MGKMVHFAGHGWRMDHVDSDSLIPTEASCAKLGGSGGSPSLRQSKLLLRDLQPFQIAFLGIALWLHQYAHTRFRQGFTAELKTVLFA